MNPEYDATTDKLKQRLDETNLVITDWRQRVKKANRMLLSKTSSLILGITSAILVAYNIVFGFIGYFFLDSGRDGVGMLLFGLTFAVVLLIGDYSLGWLFSQRSFAAEQRKNAVAFLVMAEQSAEKLNKQVADRLVGDVD
jgi:hypothetical protein